MNDFRRSLDLVCCLQAVGAAHADPHLLARILMLSGVSYFMGHWTRWLEGCHCHNDVLIECASWAELKKALREIGVDEGSAANEVGDHKTIEKP